MKLPVMLLACTLAAQSQESPQTLYAHVDFVDIAAGKRSRSPVDWLAGQARSSQ